nr:MAG TPA: hypothetical protein [Caudoviricetes sp.]
MIFKEINFQEMCLIAYFLTGHKVKFVFEVYFCDFCDADRKFGWR